MPFRRAPTGPHADPALGRKKKKRDDDVWEAAVNRGEREVAETAADVLPGVTRAESYDVFDQPVPAGDVASDLLGRRERKADKRQAILSDLLSSPYPGLDEEQSSVLNTVLGVGLEKGASAKELLAAVETGLVETGLRNLSYGDADSEGWRQERTSIYGTGKTGPTNVRASAERFFDELRSDPGTQGAPTPGLMAQAAQGSAYPERYDEQQDQAVELLQEFTNRQEKAGAQGVSLAKLAPQSRKMPGAVWFGKQAEKRFDLEARENPFFDPVDPVHTEGSHHYEEYAPGRGEAIDVVGDPAKLLQFNKWAAREFGDELTELYHDPGINISDGTRTGAIGGHGGHVHLAVDKPSVGSPVGGGLEGSAIPVSGAAPSGGVSDLMTAALDSTGQVPQLEEEDKVPTAGLSQIMGMLEAPTPSVRQPLQPLSWEDDELLKLALGRRI